MPHPCSAFLARPLKRMKQSRREPVTTPMLYMMDLNVVWVGLVSMVCPIRRQISTELYAVVTHAVPLNFASWACKLFGKVL